MNKNDFIVTLKYMNIEQNIIMPLSYPELKNITIEKFNFLKDTYFEFNYNDKYNKVVLDEELYSYVLSDLKKMTNPILEIEIIEPIEEDITKTPKDDKLEKDNKEVLKEQMEMKESNDNNDKSNIDNYSNDSLIFKFQNENLKVKKMLETISDMINSTKLEINLKQEKIDQLNSQFENLQKENNEYINELQKSKQDSNEYKEKSIMLKYNIDIIKSSIKENFSEIFKQSYPKIEKEIEEKYNNNNKEEEKKKREKEIDSLVEHMDSWLNEGDNSSNKNNKSKFNILNPPKDIRRSKNYKSKNQNNSNFFSYSCLNKDKLTISIYEGTERTTIMVILKNNGTKVWPDGKTYLICDKGSSSIKGEDISLQPQIPNTEQKYEIIFNDIKFIPAGEYKVFFIMSINDKYIGEKLGINILIK